ncbi:MAG: protocatechuate 3,4-dioxygenase subunit alpha [Marmoricola sp.]
MTNTPVHTPTPGQTVGPFYGYALPFDGDHRLVPPSHPDAIRLHGTVYDGAGDPVPDALLEIWQQAPDGSVVTEQGSLHRDGYTFTGWGRAATDPTGRFSFTTLRPGAEAGRARFFSVAVFARGLLDRLFTRAYLPDSDLLSTDPFLTGVPADRRDTLVAATDEHGLVFDVHLQGPQETVFLTFPGP